MCVGVPMQIVSTNGLVAECCVGDETRTVDLSLVGEAAVGQYALVYLNSAVRILDAEEANRIHDALAAVVAAADGQPFEHLIGDLIDREPELPPHLAATKKGAHA